jgi:UDP-glucuronate 4-epimerase
MDICENNDLEEIIGEFYPNHIFHLAAQPGVRYSRRNPISYVRNNIVAFEKLIEAISKLQKVRLYYASSSSVYGENVNSSFKEDNRGGDVKNLYALSKRFNEDRASLEYPELESVGLRFFSVYGPWGRPDMAYFRMIGSARGVWKFSQLGNGEQKRDYTFIDDVIDTLTGLMKLPKLPQVLNIGGGQPVSLNEMKFKIDKMLNSNMKIEELTRDESETLVTLADTSLLKKLRLPIPSTSIDQGLETVCQWASDISSIEYLSWLKDSK